MLNRYLRRHFRTLLSTAALLGLSGVITLYMLAYTNKLAANGVPDLNAAIWYAGRFLLSLLFTSMIAQILLARLGATLVEELRTELALKFLTIDYEKLANRGHAVYGAIIEDLGRIRPLVLFAPQLAYNTLLVALCSGYLISISASLYLVMAAFMSAALGVSLLVGKAARSHFDAMRIAEEGFFEHLRALNDGKKEFSLNRSRANHFTAHLLRPAIEKARVLMTRVHLVWAVNDSWSIVVLNSAIFAVVAFGYGVLHLPSAIIVQFVIGGLFIVSPFSYFAQTAQPVGLGLASLRHLERIGMDLQADVQPLSSASRPEDKIAADWKQIQLHDLTYRYAQSSGDESAFGVGPVTFSIQRGETLFFIGGNGSGKSTLLLLICGLLTPRQGEIRVDGRSIGSSLVHYRELFCGTFNDCFVFRHVIDSSGAVMPDHEITALLQQFALDSQVQTEGGALSRLNLSSGQRKRLALIQSYAEDRDIYFFDEWAAEQDPSFREYFYRSILPDLKRRGKTILVVSHDDRYFHLADRIIKLDAGFVLSDWRPIAEAGHPVSAAAHWLTTSPAAATQAAAIESV